MFLNYWVAITLILITALVQNTLRISFFGFDAPFYLWIPCLLYWAIYRGAWSTVFMVYFITLNTVSVGALPIGYILIFNSLSVLVLFLFKRVYYTDIMFFSIATAVALLFFPIGIWVLSLVTEGPMYFHHPVSWLLGGLVTWLISFLIFYIFQRLDQLTMTPDGEQKLPLAYKP